MKKLLCLITLFSIATTAYSGSLLDAQLNCDATFFKYIKENRQSLEGLSQIETNDDVAWFKIEQENAVIFNQPIEMNNLNVIGYSNTHFGDEALGDFYFWGLVFSNSSEEVKNRLPQINWNTAGATNEFFANAEIKKTIDSNWEPNLAAAAGIAPNKMSAERVLILTEHAGQTMLLCSIQGNVTESLLNEFRPDL